MSERRRHCFTSCSSSESGCLKYSIRSFSVCNTSSTCLATSVDSLSMVLSKALREGHERDKSVKRVRQRRRMCLWMALFVITWWSWWRGTWCCGWCGQPETPRADSAAGWARRPCGPQYAGRPKTRKHAQKHAFHRYNWTHKPISVRPVLKMDLYIVWFS